MSATPLPLRKVPAKKPRKDITESFVAGIPLSLKTLRRRTGLSHRAALGAVHDAIRKGFLRRVHPIEVGSGKYADTVDRRRMLGDTKKHPGKKTPANPTKTTPATLSRPFNVFVLV